jgi:hypothetical protein
MPETLETTPDQSQTVSYSRLSAYLECPQKYRNKYVDRLPVTQPLEDYFLKGTLSHRILEEYLQGATIEDATNLILPDWVVNNCLIPLGATNDTEDLYELADSSGLDFDLLERYVHPTAELLYRCSANYSGDEPIRKNDGSVPADPLAYPPSQFKREYERQHLHLLKAELDTQAAQASVAFRRFSLADTAAIALSYVVGFKVPEYVDHTVAVEFDLSKAKTVWDVDEYWNGAIDWVFKMKNGATVICDHKSEKRKPLGIEVLFHSQLNLYAHLYYEQTGILADYLAINHLPSGELVLAKVDIDVVQQNYLYWLSVRDKIKSDRNSNQWTKQLPTKYNSPCVRRHWKSNALTQVCPHLTSCWPQYAEYLGVELEPFLNEQSLQNAGI